MQGKKFFFYLWIIAFILPIFSLHGQAEKINGKGEKNIELSDEATIQSENDSIGKELVVSYKDKIANMSDSETRGLALRKLKNANQAHKNAKKTSREFSLKRVRLEKKLKRLSKDKKKKAAEIVVIKKELKQLRPLEKDAEKTEKLAKKKVNAVSKLLGLNHKSRKKALIKIHQSQQKLEPIRSIDTIVMKNDKIKKSARKTKKDKKDKQKNKGTAEELATNISPRQTQKVEDRKSKINEKINKHKSQESVEKVFTNYKESEDVLLNPPDTPCALAFSGKDEFTGQKRKDVASRLLFAHTDEELRPYMNGKDYLTCHAHLTSLSGGFQFLTLEITIASKNAQKEYGLINKGNILTIKTLEGDNVKLQASKSAIGKYDAFREAYAYKVSYRISGSGVKQLRKSEIDKVRIVWSSGYVDYEVYEVDFFIDQFDCLKNGE